RSYTARFWLRLSAQQHPHLNRTRKSQLTLSNTSVTISCPVALLPGCDLQRGSAATGQLRFWELLGIFWEFLREARRFSARFWLRLSAQQHPHLNRTRKSQLTLSKSQSPSASLSYPQQYPATLSIPQKTSQNFPKYPKISQNLPLSFQFFNFQISTGKKQKAPYQPNIIQPYSTFFLSP
ncbi:MAG: hypothetical protein IJV93_08755, partial [Lentisphaeria bacterium]|nr:hypothetical protein [Lentisphaeria bacterium]